MPTRSIRTRVLHRSSDAQSQVVSALQKEGILTVHVAMEA
jgi:hypothetical protein